MRKRIVIALMAVVAIGIGAYALSQPRNGTVEYHKMRYLEAWDRKNGMDWKGRLADRVGIRPPFLYASGSKRELLAEVVASHQDMLLQLGYLSERWVVFSNRSVPTMSMLTNWPTEKDQRFVDFFFNHSADRTNTIWVIAPTSTIKVWEDYFTKYDVPEKR